MVTEKDTLARYQAQIDAWIAELAQDQARTQADILTLEEKIKLEEEAREAEYAGISTKDPSDPRAPGLDSKKVAVKIAEQILPLEEKIKMEEEAREHQANPSHDPDTGKFVSGSAPKSPPEEATKKVAVKIAEKAGVSPRTV